MAAKSKKVQVRLVSTAGTGVFYVTQTKGKTGLTLNKYDKKLRKHVAFKEAKMK